MLALGIAKVVNRPISLKPLHANQIRKEIIQSLRAILIFGVGMLLPWLMLKKGFTSIIVEANVAVIFAEGLALIIWNDIHFYGMHRLLHRRFKKAHGIHHQSIASTPFSAYSMSITEAVLLGSVMPLAMLFHHFSLQALLFLPVWSIFINTLAHSNCNLFPKASANSLLGFIKHHQDHHSYYQGNYSFFFPQLDRWLGTSRSHIESQRVAK
ncbi:MAG: sterol desaturase family protein [Methylophilaceae bacterium]